MVVMVPVARSSGVRSLAASDLMAEMMAGEILKTDAEWYSPRWPAEMLAGTPWTKPVNDWLFVVLMMGVMAEKLANGEGVGRVAAS